MKKEEALQRWQDLTPGQNPLPAMTPIAYKATGSSYGACGVRIDGNPEFVDRVLSCLKDLLAGENHVTRLELARNPVKSTVIAGKAKEFHKADRGAEVCYIRLHMRGEEGAMASAVFDRHLDGATETFARALGVK